MDPAENQTSTPLSLSCDEFPPEMQPGFWTEMICSSTTELHSYGVWGVHTEKIMTDKLAKGIPVHSHSEGREKKIKNKTEKDKKRNN